MGRTLLLLSAALFVAWAGAAGSGVRHARIAFYRAYPVSRVTLVARMSVKAAHRRFGRRAAQQSVAAVVTVAGHDYTLAFDQKSRKHGWPEFVVAGVPSAPKPDHATLDGVVTQLYRAETGAEALVVLTKEHGPDQVVTALYRPKGASASPSAHHADRAVVWVGGKAHRYRIATAGGGAQVELRTPSGTRSLAATLSSLGAG